MQIQTEVQYLEQIHIYINGTRNDTTNKKLLSISLTFHV